MFGNMATFAQQINPFNPQRGMPTYVNPMAGTNMGPMSAPGAASFNQVMGAMSGITNAAVSYGVPIMAGAGMMMGGPLGGMLDPFTGAGRAFGRSIGWQRGAGLMSNLGRIPAAGLGGLTRGIGAAAMGALPAMALAQGIQYVGGQAINTMQFQNQTSAFLQNAFRFNNPMSRTGMGFSQTQQQGIADMLRTMGSRDVMTTPQELLQITKQGTQMGMFRGVEDARAFKRRFIEMKNTLKEIASTFNTTLGEAMPFLSEARRMGFWTANDITKHARDVRSVQSVTGMSAQQVQQTMAMGAQMSRGIGGTGAQGARMMAAAQRMTGSALYGGVINSQQLADAGLGTGEEGARNLGQLLAGASARFARSRVGRWVLAASMNREGTGLDPRRLQELMAGGMSVREIGGMARRNVAGGRAYGFVENEEDMRGELAQMGPRGMMGFTRGILGRRLYGGTSRDRLITRRIIRRFMGGTRRQADMIAKMMRDMPRLMEIQTAKTETSLDLQQRQRDEVMNNEWEQMKRGIGQWWRRNIDEPIGEATSNVSYSISKAFQRFNDKLFGTGGGSVRLSDLAVRGLVRAAETGNVKHLEEVFGPAGMMERFQAGEMGGGGRRGIWGALSGVDQGALMFGQRRGAMRLGMGGMVTTGTAEALGFGTPEQMQGAMTGAGAKQIQKFLRSAEAVTLRGRIGGTGELSEQQNLRYAGDILRMVRSGRAGEAARGLVEGGRTGGQRLARLIAAQGGARGGFTGIAPVGGRGAGAGVQATRAQIEEMRNEAIKGLQGALAGIGAGEGKLSESMVTAAFSPGKTRRGIEELRQDPRGQLAFNLLARAKQIEEKDPDKAASLRSEARDQIRLVAEDANAPKASRDVALSMQDPADPRAKTINEWGAKIGESDMLGNTLSYREKIKGRRERLNKALGPKGQDRLRQITGGSETELGRVVMSMTDPTQVGSAQNILGGTRKMARELLRDPEKAREIMGLLEQEGAAGTEFGGYVEQAIMMSQMSHSLGLKKDIGPRAGVRARKAASKGIGAMLNRIGLRGKVDAEGLISGKKGAQEKLAEMLRTQRGWSNEDIKGFLERTKGGLTEAEWVKQSELIIARSGPMGLSQTVAKESGLKESEIGRITGREGSPQYRGVQLKIANVHLAKLNTTMEAIAREQGVKIRRTKE